MTYGRSRSAIAEILLDYRRVAREHPDDPLADDLVEAARTVRLELRERRRVARELGSPNKPGIGIA